VLVRLCTPRGGPDRARGEYGVSCIAESESRFGVSTGVAVLSAETAGSGLSAAMPAEHRAAISSQSAGIAWQLAEAHLAPLTHEPTGPGSPAGTPSIQLRACCLDPRPWNRGHHAVPRRPRWACLTSPTGRFHRAHRGGGNWTECKGASADPDSWCTMRRNFNLGLGLAEFLRALAVAESGAGFGVTSETSIGWPQCEQVSRGSAISPQVLWRSTIGGLRGLRGARRPSASE
jgi:hypothetical protein